MGCLIFVLIIAGMLTLPSIVGPLIFWSLAGILAVQDKNNQRQAQQLQQQAKQHRELLKAVNPQAYQELVEKEAAEAAAAAAASQARASKAPFLMVIGLGGFCGLCVIFLGIYFFIGLGTHSTSSNPTTRTSTATEAATPAPTLMAATPEPTATEPISEDVTTPIPVRAKPTPRSAQLDLQGAEEDLNQAWKALTEKQRSQLREEEKNWGKRKDALPLEDRIKSTQQRAKYLWSLVERTFDD